jgi:osmotically-inducible protein OsmY
MKRLIKNPLFVLIVILSLGIAQILFAATDPQKLAQKVEAAIGNYYYNSNLNIKADVNGKVTINGDVNSLYDRLRIFEIVSKVPGVVFIENKLMVKTPDVPDQMILDKILSQIKIMSSILEPDRIKVNVTNGFVFLTGEVSYYREKLVAATVATIQEGVKGIENDLVVLPQQKAVSDDNLKIVLQEILKNHFGLAKNVSFTVANGVVTLTGKARLLWEKNMIEEEFSKVLGINKVINNLEVVKEE